MILSSRQWMDLFKDECWSWMSMSLRQVDFPRIIKVIWNGNGLGKVRRSSLFFVCWINESNEMRSPGQWRRFRSNPESVRSTTIGLASVERDERSFIFLDTSNEHSLECRTTIHSEHIECLRVFPNAQRWISARQRNSIVGQCSSSSASDLESFSPKIFNWILTSSFFCFFWSSQLSRSRSLVHLGTFTFLWFSIEHESVSSDFSHFLDGPTRQWTSSSAISDRHSSWSCVDHSTNVSSECHRSSRILFLCGESHSHVIDSFGNAPIEHPSILCIHLPIWSNTPLEHFSPRDRWMDNLLSIK